MAEELIRKIRDRRACISVIGLGHVGLPTAAVFADGGYAVVGSDVNKKLVRTISSLRYATRERGLDELVKKGLESGKLKVIDDTASAVRQTDVALICVQTPLAQSGKPDLRPLESATRNVAKGLAKGKLVVVESTVPPGTVKNFVKGILEDESGLRCGSHFGLAYCPERILPGNTIEELRGNDRLVGGFDPQSAATTAELFKSIINGKVLVTTIENAEMAKLAENTFRYVNIAFANELALMCEEVGADIIEVIKLANSHPRVNIHRPGPGVGGPCLTKDPQLLLHPEGHQPLNSKLILCSEELNAFMANHTVELIVGALRKEGKRIKNSRIAVFGTAYKAEVSDATSSPVEKLIHRLMHLGAEVRAYDPYADESFGAERTDSLTNAASAADCIVIGTDHKMFVDLPFKELKTLMKEKPIIVDAKRIVNFEDARQKGFSYYGIGFGIR